MVRLQLSYLRNRLGSDMDILKEGMKLVGVREEDAT